jgi:hypothetical protein
MSRNESTIDRIIRATAAVLAVVVAVVVGAGSVAGVLLLVVAAILLVTSLMGFCPLYRVLGLSTHHAATKVGPRV